MKGINKKVNIPGNYFILLLFFKKNRKFKILMNFFISDVMLKFRSVHKVKG